MARLDCCVNFRNLQLAAAATWKTMASIEAPAEQMIAIKRIKITGNGIAGDAEPIEVRLTRVEASSGTGTATTPQKINNALTATPQATARVAFSSEPTEDGTDPYLYPSKFHPQGGSVDELTFDGEIIVAEGTELALEMQVPTAGTQIYVSGHIIYEE